MAWWLSIPILRPSKARRSPLAGGGAAFSAESFIHRSMAQACHDIGYDVQGYKLTDARTSRHEWATAAASCTPACQRLSLGAAWTSKTRNMLKEGALSNQHLQLP